MHERHYFPKDNTTIAICKARFEQMFYIDNYQQFFKFSDKNSEIRFKNCSIVLQNKELFIRLFDKYQEIFIQIKNEPTTVNPKRQGI